MRGDARVRVCPQVSQTRRVLRQQPRHALLHAFNAGRGPQPESAVAFGEVTSPSHARSEHGHLSPAAEAAPGSRQSERGEPGRGLSAAHLRAPTTAQPLLHGTR